MASLFAIAFVRVFNVVAFALAIAAELRRSTAKLVPDEEKNYVYCLYNNSGIATVFGVSALLFLLLSQVTVMTATRKCGFCSTGWQSSGCRSCALFVFFFSWLTFLIAEAFLLAGTVQNMYRTRYRVLFFMDPPTCQMVRKGVFAAGAVFILFTAILTELYYITFSEAQKIMDPPYGKDDVGMAPEKIVVTSIKNDGTNLESILKPLLTCSEVGVTTSGNT